MFYTDVKKPFYLYIALFLFISSVLVGCNSKDNSDMSWSFTGSVTSTASSNSSSNSVISITSPTNGSYINSSTNSGAFTVSGNCTVTSQQVSIYIDGNVATITGGICNGSTFTSTISTTGMSEGAHSFVAKITNLQGNVDSSTAVSVTKDTSAPTGFSMALNSPLSSLSNQMYPVIEVTSISLNDTVQIFIDSLCNSSISSSGISSGNSIRITTDRLTTDGSYSFYAKVTDQAGNATCGASPLSYTLDITPPTVSGLSNDATKTKSKTWSWGCSEGSATYQYEIDTTSNTTPTAAYGSSTSASQSSGDGTYYIHVRCKDAAGNASSIVHASALLDNTAPTAPTSLGWNHSSPYNSTSVTANWTRSNSSDLYDQQLYLYNTIDCSGGFSQLSSLGTTQQESLTLSTGYNTYQIKSYDDVGNYAFSPCSSIMTIDTVKPTVTINQSSGQSDPASSFDVLFNVVFSEAIDPATFSTADITQSGDASGVQWELAAVNSTTYTLKAKQSTSTGIIKPTIAVNTFSDLAGNLNDTASTGTDNEVTYSGLVVPVISSLKILNDENTNSRFIRVNVGTISGSPTHFCLLVNDTVSSNCTWIAGSMPTFKEISNAIGYNENIQITAFAKNATFTSSALTSSAIRFSSLSISAGANHSCASDASGNVKCWGTRGTYGSVNLNYGQLGVGTMGNITTGVFGSLVPTIVRNATNNGNLSNVVQVSVGLYHTCALTSGHQVYCWGDNSYGQLGVGNYDNSALPKLISSLSNIYSISSGDYHVCALNSSGNVYCWGLSSDGQLGNGSTSQSNIPVSVLKTDGSVLPNVIEIQSGDSHVCAITSSNNLYCWGDGLAGKLVPGNTADLLRATQITGMTNVGNIALGWDHTCATNLNGELYCWGRGVEGQTGTSFSNSASIQAVGTNVSYIYAGGDRTCYKAGNGNAYCFGENIYGALGINTNSNVYTPTLISNLHSTIATLEIGEYHTCAINVISGTYSNYCWGKNDNGQLGINSTNSTPAQYIPNVVNTAIVAPTINSLSISLGGVSCSAGVPINITYSQNTISGTDYSSYCIAENASCSPNISSFLPATYSLSNSYSTGTSLSMYFALKNAQNELSSPFIATLNCP